MVALKFCFFPGPAVALGIQLCLAFISICLVLIQKFMLPPEITEGAAELGIMVWCGLNSEGDNAWTFGQTVALTLLFLPVLSIMDNYSGKTKSNLSRTLRD